MLETQETWVQSLGWGDPREQGMAAHSSVLARGLLWTEEPGGLIGHGVTESWARLSEHARTMFESCGGSV